MGIRDKPIAPASPWQNGFAERLIGAILRRECVDHFIVLGEAHLRASCEPMLATTTKSERIVHWTKMRRALAPFSGLDQ
jgi:transposase InsO family protein